MFDYSRGTKHPYGRRYSSAVLAERNYRDIQSKKNKRMVLTILLCLVWYLAGFASCWLLFIA